MPLSSGTRIGPYEIQAALGAGGMGEVYRARDSKLGRDVAIKIVSDSFATNPGRLARIQREAHVLAALNHPHIAAIYGLEDSNGSPALVLELVEGPTLADRLAQGPMPVDEALVVARQIAGALEAAHAQGIIHRDLKPANIKLRPDGTVKVLDFGLAKALEPAAVTPETAQSPTITSPAMTSLGLILGTAAYMSPEQAKGRAVDKRADIWAFGCVLYEMLTGRRLFAGEDVSETLAAVLRADPDWRLLPPETPDAIRRLLRRCLARDPQQRLPDIGVARFEIDDALSGSTAAAAPPREPSRVWPAAALIGLAGLALGAVAMSMWQRFAPAADAEPRVLQITTGENLSAPALAPNGRAVAFVRKNRLVVRSIESGDEIELTGTDGASNPFWSPDSQNLAYFGSGDLGPELRVVAAAGGPSRIVVRDSLQATTRRSPFAVAGGAWCGAGIVYAGLAPRRLLVVDGDGKERELSAGDNPPGGIGGLAYPHCLGDGRVLAVLRRAGVSAIVVVTTTAVTTLLELPASNTVAVRWPVLVGSTHVVFERTEPNPGLWSLPVAPDLSARTGPERLVLADAGRPGVANGVLIALTGVRNADRELVWVDRSGKRLGTFGRPQREFLTPSLSPDGTQLITGGRRQETDEIWLHRHDTFARWINAGQGGFPEWSRDGTRVVYVAKNRSELIVRTARGTDPRQIATGTNLTGPAWAPDGALVYSTPRDNTVWLVKPNKNGPGHRLLEDARDPAISPDGRLIAYASIATGRSEVHVTTFPTPGQASPVSTDGGRFPRWSPKGSELFFPCGPPVGEDPQSSRDLCVAAIDPTTGARRGAPTLLFDAWARDLRLASYGQRGYDVSPDGTRILVQTSGLVGTPAVTLIDNAEAWLHRRAQ